MLQKDDAVNHLRKSRSDHRSILYSAETAAKTLTSAQQREEEATRRRHREWEAAIRRHRIEEETSRQFVKANSYTISETLAIAILSGMLTIACLFFLYNTATVWEGLRAVNNLRSQYQEICQENSILEANISGSIDPDALYSYATEDLGMVYPEKAQVVTFEQSRESGVRQNEKIPDTK